MIDSEILICLNMMMKKQLTKMIKELEIWCMMILISPHRVSRKKGETEMENAKVRMKVYQFNKTK